MLESKLFLKTRKESPKDAESINHKLLVRAGFVDQLMAGSWTLLPLGLRVVNKINQVIREEVNAIGGQEMLMPLMTPKSVWEATGRWDKAKDIMYQFKDKRGREYGLAFTHEEIVLDLLQKNVKSYKDLPIYLYHFSTKFRNEARARSGILRGREFLMKDLYSAHTSEEDLMEFYERVKGAYSNIFTRLGFDFRIIEASGGVFTKNYTHEFQVLTPSGEDTIYFCGSCGWGQNKEIFKGHVDDECPECSGGKLIESKSIEVGNIFPLGKWFAEKVSLNFIDKDGKNKPVWFGSYGIGPTRVMGTWVEVSHDNKGVIWNKAMSPFDVHLIELSSADRSREVYETLLKMGSDVLYDDRDVPAGQKLFDADLIGIPYRLVISKTTGDKIEWKERSGDKSEILSMEQTINRLQTQD